MWTRVEHCLENQPADILLIFDCCYAGYLRRCHRAPHSFEFLGACEEKEKTFGPGDKSFTKALIWALKGLAGNEKGFDSRALKDKTLTHPEFSKTKLTPALFPRGVGSSTAHIWIEPAPRDICHEPGNVEVEQPRGNTIDATTRPEWVDLAFIYNRPPGHEDVQNLALALTEFAAGHSSYGLERIVLYGKSPNPRLKWRWVTQFLDRIGRRSIQRDTAIFNGNANISIQQGIPSGSVTPVPDGLSPLDANIQLPLTPMSGVGGLQNGYIPDREIDQKTEYSLMNGRATAVATILQRRDAMGRQRTTVELVRGIALFSCCACICLFIRYVV